MTSAKVRLLSLGLLVVGLLALIPAQAQISFRGAGAQSVTTGASLVPVIPAGTQAGDFAVLVVAGRPSDTSTPAAPAGWTLRSSVLRELGARDLKLVIYYRVLSGGDANPTLSVPSGWQGNQNGISGQIAVWSAVNTANPFDVADVTGNAAAASPWTPPAISTVTAGARAVSAVASGDDNALNLSSAQGFALRMSGATYDTTTGGDHSVGVADKDQPTAGAVTMPGWGQTVNASDAWVGISFVLKPHGAALYFIHPDHLDTPRLIANAAQQAVWRWDNDDPFGNNAPNENPSGLGNFTCNLRFPGQYYDKETNLHYNYFRDYDPAIARYIHSDPIGLAGGINTYAYVGSNPLSRIDPLGLEWQLAIGIGGSAGGNPLFPFIGPFIGGGLSVGFTSSGQLFVQAQATGSVGLGLYAGVGVQGQVSKTDCPTPSGLSVQRAIQADLNAGAGPSIGGSVQYDPIGGGRGVQTGVGKLGVGLGLQASVGVTQTVTIATPAMFPSKNLPQCGCQ